MPHIIIYSTMKSKLGNQSLEKGKTIIKNGITMTTYSNSKIRDMHIAGLKKDKKQFIVKHNIIIEKFEDKTIHQMADKIEKDLNQIAEKFKKLMSITISREYKK